MVLGRLGRLEFSLCMPYRALAEAVLCISDSLLHNMSIDDFAIA